MDRAVNKDYAEHGTVQGPADDERWLRKAGEARRAAVNEIRRETRGKAPAAYAKGGSVGSASRRADGIAKRGKTKGRML